MPTDADDLMPNQTPASTQMPGDDIAPPLDLRGLDGLDDDDEARARNARGDSPSLAVSRSRRNIPRRRWTEIDGDLQLTQVSSSETGVTEDRQRADDQQNGFDDDPSADFVPPSNKKRGRPKKRKKKPSRLQQTIHPIMLVTDDDMKKDELPTPTRQEESEATQMPSPSHSQRRDALPALVAAPQSPKAPESVATAASHRSAKRKKTPARTKKRPQPPHQSEMDAIPNPPTPYRRKVHWQDPPCTEIDDAPSDKHPRPQPAELPRPPQDDPWETALMMQASLAELRASINQLTLQQQRLAANSNKENVAPGKQIQINTQDAPMRRRGRPTRREAKKVSRERLDRLQQYDDIESVASKDKEPEPVHWTKALFRT